jgi:hypothetical protein
VFWPLIGGFIAFVLLAVVIGWVMDTTRHDPAAAAAEARAWQSGRNERWTDILRTRGLIEPDENVLGTLYNVAVPAWALVISAVVAGILLVIPYALTKPRYVVLTDKHIYLLKGRRKVAFKSPLGGVGASVEGKAFPGRYLALGPYKIWITANRQSVATANAIARAASVGRASRAVA